MKKKLIMKKILDNIKLIKKNIKEIIQVHKIIKMKII